MFMTLNPLFFKSLITAAPTRAEKSARFAWPGAACCDTLFLLD